MENKIIKNIVINMTDFEIDDNKQMIVVCGYFYFQGQKYEIVNKEIYHAHKGGLNGQIKEIPS